MIKPASMSHKEWMIKKLSIQMVISEKIIDAVINDQFDSGRLALENNKSVEFSGFAKFVFNQKRAVKVMEKYKKQKAYYTEQLEDETLTTLMRGRITKKLQTALDNIEALTPKLA
jgi:nucleoid DNA-binding protein